MNRKARQEAERAGEPQSVNTQANIAPRPPLGPSKHRRPDYWMESWRQPHDTDAPHRKRHRISIPQQRQQPKPIATPIVETGEQQVESGAILPPPGSKEDTPIWRSPRLDVPPPKPFQGTKEDEAEVERYMSEVYASTMVGDAAPDREVCSAEHGSVDLYLEERGSSPQRQEVTAAGMGDCGEDENRTMVIVKVAERSTATTTAPPSTRSVSPMSELDLAQVSSVTTENGFRSIDNDEGESYHDANEGMLSSVVCCVPLDQRNDDVGEEKEEKEKGGEEKKEEEEEEEEAVDPACKLPLPKSTTDGEESPEVAVVQLPVCIRCQHHQDGEQAAIIVTSTAS